VDLRSRKVLGIDPNFLPSLWHLRPACQRNWKKKTILLSTSCHAAYSGWALRWTRWACPRGDAATSMFMS
jgi:hypothetical protein